MNLPSPGGAAPQVNPLCFVQELQEAHGLENWGEGEKAPEQSFVLSPERRPASFLFLSRIHF
jgi:hypothetical protein